MKSRLFLSLLLLFLFVTHGFAQFRPAHYQIKGNTLPYQVLYPENYDSTQKFPLLVFLHGAGERGNDNEKQLTHGRDFLINNFHAKFPAIVIVPQCPQDSYWSNVQSHDDGFGRTFKFGLADEPTVAMETLIYLIQDWLVSGKVDTKQVYAGGLSMGGMGTYELLWRMPGTFAAAFPICGGGDVNKLAHYTKNTALWVFHGAEDNVVPPYFSRDMNSALQQEGVEVKYTEYTGVEHNSWDNVFVEGELVPWLFSHIK